MPCCDGKLGFLKGHDPVREGTFEVEGYDEPPQDHGYG